MFFHQVPGLSRFDGIKPPLDLDPAIAARPELQKRSLISLFCSESFFKKLDRSFGIGAIATGVNRDCNTPSLDFSGKGVAGEIRLGKDFYNGVSVDITLIPEFVVTGFFNRGHCYFAGLVENVIERFYIPEDLFPAPDEHKIHLPAKIQLF